MSLFLAYFEMKNEKSTNYAGFKSVGKFIIPDAIAYGKISVLCKGRPHVADIISDNTKQCANDLFSKGALKKILFDFIKSRMCSNDCVVPIIGGFIMQKSTNLILIEKLKIIKLDIFEHEFSGNMFGNSVFFKIIL